MEEARAVITAFLGILGARFDGWCCCWQHCFFFLFLFLRCASSSTVVFSLLLTLQWDSVRLVCSFLSPPLIMDLYLTLEEGKGELARGHLHRGTGEGDVTADMKVADGLTTEEARLAAERE